MESIVSHGTVPKIRGGGGGGGGGGTKKALRIILYLNSLIFAKLTLRTKIMQVLGS